MNSISNWQSRGRTISILGRQVFVVEEGRPDAPAIAYRLLDDMPHAKLTFMEELGHYPMLEDPAGWSGHLLEFIDRMG